MTGWFAWVRGRRTGAAAPVNDAFDPFELQRAISTQDRASIVRLAAGPAGERRDRFVERLAGTGGAALAPLLDETEIAEVARRYACHDRRADDARARFDRASRAANSLVLVAALANAASLGIATTFPAGAGPLWVNPCIVTLGILSTLAGATAATLLFFISGGKLLERWLAARADAEGVRLDYFKRIVEKDPPTPPADPAGLLAAKLAFFWCFQYEQQRRYLAGRAAEHEREADVYLAVGAFAVFLQSLAAAGGGVLGAQDRRFMWLTAAATLGPAFAAFATSREAIRQNRVRAERFRGIDEALSEAGERLSEVERAVGNGDPEPLKAFVAAVHEPLAGEIRQFQAGGDAVRAALDKLNATLEDGGKAPGARDGQQGG